MATFISYLLTSGIVLLILYLIYKWLLARETFCHFNRIYLLASYAVAFLIFPIAGPLKGTLGGRTDAAISDIELGQMTATLIPAGEDGSFLSNWVIYAIMAIVIAGMAVMTIQTIIVAAHIVGTIRCGERQKFGRYTVVLTENSRLAPFSWCGFIIMNRNDFSTGREMILNHETNHQRYLHWIDLLIAQTVIILQWFNPVAWLMRDELRNVHEYEADMAVLRAGANAKEYQLLLIKKAVGAKFPALANCLNHSKLKKRITMMLKTKSSPWARMRAFVALPAIALAAAVINPQAVASALTPTDNDKVTQNSAEPSSISATKTESEAKTNETVFKSVEQMPQFVGGEAELMRFISTHLVYPTEAKEKNIQGRVVIQFVVTSTGAIGETKLLRSVDPLLDRAAIDVVKSLPNFIPGKVNGEPVSVFYTIPISFKLD